MAKLDTLNMPRHLHLVVHYRTPSLNVTKRQHWAAQAQEKHAAFRALLSALSATAADRLTRITSPAVSKTCSTACATLESYLATSRGASGWKRNKFAWLTAARKRRRLMC